MIDGKLDENISHEVSFSSCMTDFDDCYAASTKCRDRQRMLTWA